MSEKPSVWITEDGVQHISHAERMARQVIGIFIVIGVGSAICGWRGALIAFAAYAIGGML